MKLVLTQGLGLIFLALLTGCQHPGPNRFDPRAPDAAPAPASWEQTASTNHLDPALLDPSSDLFRLGPGDRLEIEIVSDVTSRSTVTVGPDGKIYYGLLSGLDVWGMTLNQAREAIEKGMSRYLREAPAVEIVLRDVESKKIWMLGRFQAPGIYPMTNSITLLEAIFQAGGPQNMGGGRESALAGTEEDLADLQHSFVLRRGQLLPISFTRLLRGDLSQNIYLQGDDFVYLAPQTADEVHVFGAIAQPRAVPYVRELTLVQAIANAGGTIRDAYQGQVAIVRGSLTKPSIALVSYVDIVKGRASDVRLAPGDIVYVPYRPWKVLTKYLDVIATTFASSIAINAGAEATLKVPPPQAGILIPFGSGITVQGSGTIVR
ncbi:MAG TPA: polysaccharide biosynthesis/export family protein [Verrucomicrobiae bacterium]|jgi:protein involved in polysaccharide export with SLBB domain|nr:polysaccharide biosynthesis/export family protein [Verrucomicrobiae bacterium]